MKHIEEMISRLKQHVEAVKVREQKALIKSEQAANAIGGLGGIMERRYSMDEAVNRFFNELCLIDEYDEPDTIAKKNKVAKMLDRQAFKCSRKLGGKFSDVVKSKAFENVGLFDLDYLDDNSDGYPYWNRVDILAISETYGLRDLCEHLNEALPEFSEVAKKIGPKAFCKELCKGGYNKDFLHYDKLIPLFFGWAYVKEIEHYCMWDELLGGDGLSIVDNVRISVFTKGGSEVEVMQKRLEELANLIS